MNKIIVLLMAMFVFVSHSSANPSFPADFDIGENSVRGGKMGERINIQITPYNAGQKLFENEQFTVFERINFLSSDPDQYGDPVCSIFDPGTNKERYHSRVVVVFNVDRDERISEDRLWDELRPVLSELIHPAVCPKANYITAHIYAKNWDLSAAGQEYHPEYVPMPVVELGPRVEPKDFGLTRIDVRNQNAYDLIQELVSEGILVAHFQYNVVGAEVCTSSYPKAGCTRELFAPLYWGAPDVMTLYSAVNRLLSDSPSRLDAQRAHVEKLREQYAQYTSFDGYVSGFIKRTERTAKARARNQAIQDSIDAFNRMLKLGVKQIEEHGLSAPRKSGSGGPCDPRFYAGSCIEDVIYIPGYL